MKLKLPLGLCGMALLFSAPVFAKTTEGAPIPANDECANATVLSLDVLETFDTTSATFDPALPFPCQSQGGADVWFTFTPGATDDFVLSACGSSFDTVLEIFDGTCGALVSLECNDNFTAACGSGSNSYIEQVTLAMGTTYYVRLGGFQAQQGPAQLLVSPYPHSANDLCVDAIALTPDILQTWNSRNDEGMGPFACEFSDAGDVWYTFTPPSTAEWSFSTCGSTMDTLLEILDGTCGNFTVVHCVDEGAACGYGPSLIETTALMAGTTYYIRVGGLLNYEWDGQLLVTRLDGLEPANDDCPNPIALTLDVLETFDTTGATLDPALPFPCQPNADADVWFTFTPGATDQYDLSSCGSSFNTVLEIFDGTCGALTSLACSDDSLVGCQSGAHSFIQGVPLVMGTTYYVRLGGDQTQEGIAQLLVSLFPNSVNDLCVDAIALIPDVVETWNCQLDELIDPFSCGAGDLGDVWYTFTPPDSSTWSISTCGSGFNTLLEIMEGTCGNFAAVDCDDNGAACGGSGASLIETTALVAGTTYYIRVGGYNTNNWDGELLVTRMLPEICLTTTLNGGDEGPIGGAVFLTVETAQSALEVSSLETSFSALAGSPVGVEVWTKPGSYFGNEQNAALWTQVAVDDGLAISAGENALTMINLLSPFTFSPGLTSVALVARGSGHSYTPNLTGVLGRKSTYGVIRIKTGVAQDIPFVSEPILYRLWNGTLCHNIQITPTGTPFCEPAGVNSTGEATELTGWFDTNVGSGLHLDANNGPPGQFGYLVVGSNFSEPGIPGGPTSVGTLCLSNSAIGIRRYNLPFNGWNSIGIFSGGGMFRNIAGTSISGFGFDVPALVAASNIMIMAGDTYHFQLFYRDGSGLSNLSNGLSVTF